MPVAEPLVVAGAAFATGIAATIAAGLVARRRTTDVAVAMLQQQLDGLRGQIGVSLDSSARAVNERLDANLTMVGQRFMETATLVTSVRERLTELEQAASRIFDVGRDLTSLQALLQPPKARGGIGEILLEQLLRDRLPEPRYRIQHRFRSGATVDAVILLDDHLVPIDSKFPLEGFRAVTGAVTDEARGRARREFLRDVQGHIKAIADKYILPAEGTCDFALMYVPSESVFYEAVVRGDEAGSVYAFAMERRVIPVSPSTFYAYLMAVVFGLKGRHVERQAAQIRADLAHLGVSFDHLREPFERLGEQLRRAQKNYDETGRAVERFGDRLRDLNGLSLPEEAAQPTARP